MKPVLAICVLALLSLCVSAQSFIALGPQVSTTTSSGSPGGSQTQAGGILQGQFVFPIGPVKIGMGGFMGLFNQPRFFDNGGGSAFEADPEGTMSIPISGHWSAVVLGGADMQRFNSITVVNPTAGIGAEYTRNDDTTAKMRTHARFIYKCLFDDVNNSTGAKVFRGYEVNGYLIKMTGEHFGFLVGGKYDRQSNGVLTAPRSQPGVYGGIAIAP